VDADKGGYEELFLPLLSRSIALQRALSTVSLTVTVRRSAQNARQNKRFSGSEMIEWE
jgi:hypothetical protein